MYSQTHGIARYKTFMAVMLIVSMLIFTPPKRTDGFILMIIGVASVGQIIADILILCALGIICGDGDGGTTDVGPGPTCPAGQTCACVAEQGQSCGYRNACGVDGPTNGTIDCQGICRNATLANEYTGPSCESSANICGMTSTGNLHCTNGSCNAGPTPSDSLCTSQPLGPGSVVINPTVVRIGETVTISWDTGTNYPPLCTITGTDIGGPGINTYTFAANEQTGSRTVTVSGPHQYTLTCGTVSATETVMVLPTLYES